MNDKDEKIVYYFKKLFNITFSQCMDKFKGNNEVKELEGFTTFNEITNELPGEPEYIEAFQFNLAKYSIWLIVFQLTLYLIMGDIYI